MKKYVIMVAVFSLFVLCVWQSYSRGNQEIQFPKIRPKGPVKTFSFKTKQEATRNYNPALFPEVAKIVSGTANANAKKETGEIWGVAIDDGQVPDDFFNIGFASNGLRNTGPSDWEKVTVSATVMISAVTGPADIAVSPLVGNEEVPNSFAMLSVEKPGTYTVISGVFNMKPNLDYSAFALVRGQGLQNKPGGIAGKFVSIKFVF